MYKNTVHILVIYPYNAVHTYIVVASLLLSSSRVRAIEFGERIGNPMALPHNGSVHFARANPHRLRGRSAQSEHSGAAREVMK